MKNNTRITLRYYWRHLWKYKWWFFLTIGAVIGASILSIIVPLYLKYFFDLLPQIGDGVNSIRDGLIEILIIIAILELGQWVLWRTSGFVASYFYSHVMADLSNYCFTCLHRHSFNFFNDNFVGSLVKRANRFVWSFENILDNVIWFLLQLTVNIVVILIVLFGRNWQLGMGVLVWLLVFLLINFFLTKIKLRYDVRRNELETKTSGFLADSITNHLNLKLFNASRRERKNYADWNEKVRSLRFYAWTLDNIFEAGQTLLMVGLEIGVFYFAIGFWQQGLLTIGDFVLIQSYLLVIFRQVWNFGRTIRHIYQSLADADDMTQILEMSYEIKDIPKAQKLKVKMGEIKFDQVNFNYHQTRQILKDFAVVIRPQEKVALVGPSGAGKSTIVRLLLRLHDIDAGHILIDDQDIARVTQESLWSAISFVPQDPILFHRTLMENIRYGRPQASDKEVVRAAKLAHCHEFISQLSDKYNTYVGERGVKLSGGERQRVAIARAILRNAPILILDEATSSLDSESEYFIQDALNNLMKNKTVIVIAHRLSTIMKTDRILVIDKGGVLEEGTHESLLKKSNGVYKKLWRIQAGGFIE